MTKKTRCTCKRCGKVNYLPSAGIDSSEPFLCEPCDSKYIVWFEQTTVRSYGLNVNATLARFLRECPARQR